MTCHFFCGHCGALVAFPVPCREDDLWRYRGRTVTTSSHCGRCNVRNTVHLRFSDTAGDDPPPRPSIWALLLAFFRRSK